MPPMGEEPTARLSLPPVLIMLFVFDGFQSMLGCHSGYLLLSLANYAASHDKQRRMLSKFITEIASGSRGDYDGDWKYRCRFIFLKFHAFHTASFI